MLSVRALQSLSTRVPSRAYAAGAAAKDPIQKLFLDKISEYRTKSKTAEGGLVGADEKVKAQLAEELNRVRNNFQIKNDEDKLTSSFSDENFKIDPIN